MTSTGVRPASSAKNKINFSAEVTATLKNKVQEHNAKASDGRKATLGMLKAVYRRGAGAYSSSHRPGTDRNQWAMARVNAFLRLLRTGRPANSNYVQDNDLLPHGHPRSSKASASVEFSSEGDIFAELLSEEDYESPEHALVAMAELSTLSYEGIPALRAAWMRGVRDNESPFDRAAVLASALDKSKDSDLLPKNLR
jgi:hypothetical protein